MQVILPHAGVSSAESLKSKDSKLARSKLDLRLSWRHKTSCDQVFDGTKEVLGLQTTAFTRSASRIYQKRAQNGALAQGLESLPSVPPMSNGDSH